MRKAKQEEKQNNEVIEIPADVKINEDTILEKGDKIEVLGKKVEEERLTEDDYKEVLPEFARFVAEAKQKGISYLASDLIELFVAVQRSSLETGEGTEVAEMFSDLYMALDRWK